MKNPTEHFYNEIYSYYYTTVGRFINSALKGELTFEREEEILYENNAFSAELIRERIHDFPEWFLIKDQAKKIDGKYVYDTYIKEEYSRPETLLEKRWLKSIIRDPRIQLFDIDFEKQLKDVEPLFDSDDFYSVGFYGDGDDYSDESYKKNFRMILYALKNGWALRLMSENAAGRVSKNPYVFVPDHLEYSEVEDKFTLFGHSPDHHHKNTMIKLSRIRSCELCSVPEIKEADQLPMGKLVMLLDKEAAGNQNVLERILIEFSHHNKRVNETDDSYRIEIDYYLNEEKDIIVHQIMPFAHYVKILSPDSVKNNITDRIRKQRELFSHLFSE